MADKGKKPDRLREIQAKLKKKQDKYKKQLREGKPRGGEEQGKEGGKAG